MVHCGATRKEGLTKNFLSFKTKRLCTYWLIKALSISIWAMPLISYDKHYRLWCMQNPTQSQTQSLLLASTVEVQNKTNKIISQHFFQCKIFMSQLWTTRCKWKSLGTTFPIFVCFCLEYEHGFWNCHRYLVITREQRYQLESFWAFHPKSASAVPTPSLNLWEE